MPSRLEQYPLNDDSPVSLDVVIGDAQAGSTTIYLGNHLLANGPGVNKLTLGNRHALKNKRLVVSTIVLDVQPNTNRTSVSLSLAGGGGVGQNWKDEEEAKPNGVVTHLAIVDFTE